MWLVWACWHPCHPPPLWIADQVRNDVCGVLGAQAGMTVMVGVAAARCLRPSGLRIKSAMTGRAAVILASRQYPQGGACLDTTSRHCGLDPQSRGSMAWGYTVRHAGHGSIHTVGWGCVVLLSPSAPSVRHWDRLWSSPIKGEGIRLCCLIVVPSLRGYCLEASMTDPAVLHPVD